MITCDTNTKLKITDKHLWISWLINDHKLDPKAANNCFYVHYVDGIKASLYSEDGTKLYEFKPNSHYFNGVVVINKFPFDQIFVSPLDFL